MVTFVYTEARPDIQRQWENVSAFSTIKATLVGSGYVAQQCHVYASAISGFELFGTGFTAGFSGTIRLTLVSRTLTINHAENQVQLDAEDKAWSAASVGTIAGIVLLRESGNDALSPLIAFLDGGGLPVETTGQTFNASWPASGVITVISD